MDLSQSALDKTSHIFYALSSFWYDAIVPMRINTDKKIMICLSYSILVTLEHKIYQIFVVGIVQCLEIERKVWCHSVDYYRTER